MRATLSPRLARQDGYIVFGIAVALIVLGIFMGMAVPLWQKVMQREREQELIFRGYQYMQAIELYQRKFPGAYPPNLDILVDQKFLRKAYKDPMTEDGEWRFIRQLSPELQPGGQAPGQSTGISDLNRSQARTRTPGSATPGAAGATRSATGERFTSATGRSSMGSGDAGQGGIVGVASKSEEETFYKVPGKEKYKDWLFVFGAQQGQPGQVAQPGQAGRAGQPGQMAGGVGGLPPPPGNVALRFGAGAPGQPPGGPVPPGLGNQGQPGRQPGLGQPGQPGLGQPGQPGGGGFNPGVNPPGGQGGPGQQQPNRQQNRRPPGR